MYTLILSSWELPNSHALAAAARASRGEVICLEEHPAPGVAGPVVYWGEGEVGLATARRCGQSLVEPPFDLLARLPYPLRLRAVEYCRLGDLQERFQPSFLKPADSVRKSFDAGIYAALEEIEGWTSVPAATPVLASERVEWLAEYRCFVLERKIAAVSPYLSFGQVSWRPYVRGSGPVRVPPQVGLVFERLVREMGRALPPAYVVDIGLIDERDWAVVEFNPAWCASLLGCDPEKVLPVLRRATCRRAGGEAADRRWLVNRPERR